MLFFYRKTTKKYDYLVVSGGLCHYTIVMIDLYSEIKNRYGNVKRTRGYYIYTEKNIRLTDMYLDGGMAILGRRNGQANLAAKQLLDKGLQAFLPSKMDYQLEKAVCAALPEFPVIRFYHSQERAVSILSTLLKTPGSLYDLPVWRAFLDVPLHQTEACIVIPVYPVPYGIIAAKTPLSEKLPPSDKMFPPLAASLARAFFDVKRKMDKRTPPLPQSDSDNKSIKQRSALEAASATIWQQKGCYLFPHIPESAYPALFMKALDNRIIISPDYRIPSIMPVLAVYTELLTFFNTLSNSVL